MAFAARKEDGEWRLCKRGGDAIGRISPKYPHITIKFSSQAKTKACADELNERFWKAYSKRTADTPFEHYWEMLEVIHRHGGLTDDEYESLGK